MPRQPPRQPPRPPPRPPRTPSRIARPAPAAAGAHPTPPAALNGVRGIASRTGLSTATVSRVINGQAGVAEATRQKVLAAVLASGFEPNAAARALSTRRSRTIGAVIPILAHSIFATFLNGIERELALHGYALVVATTGGSLVREASRARELLQLGAEGLIVSGATHDPAFAELVLARRVPVVATSIFDARSAWPTIRYDNRHLGEKALAHLLSLGHRRVAVLHGPVADNDRTRLRLAGVRSAAAAWAAVASPATPTSSTTSTSSVTAASKASKASKASNPSAATPTLHFVETSLDATGGAVAARAALAARPPCTALLCLSDVLALGAMFEARRAGVEVPGQLSIMGFDDLDWAAISEPPLTTLRLPTAQMGELAARALVDRLDSGIAIKPRLLDAEVVLRGSTAAAPGARARRPATARPR